MTGVDNLNFILNCFIHVTILFIFLTLLYYYVICPITTHSLRELIGPLIDSIFDANVPSVIISLSNIQDSINSNILDKNQILFNTDSANNIMYDTKKFLNTDILNNSFTNYDITNTQRDSLKLFLADHIYNNLYILNNYIEQNSTVNDLVNRNNESVISFAFVSSISLTVITTFLMISIKISSPHHINLSELLFENFATFIFVGIIEYWFFTTYALRYVPVPASLITSSSIDTIISLLKKQYIYSNSQETPPLIVKPTKIIL